MPTVLNLKPEEVDGSEKRSKYTVSVIGCGTKGILYANAFAEAGFSVICTDANPMVIKKVTKGKTPTSQLQAETTLKNHINTGQISVRSEREKAISRSESS
jgi:UDP-N-acetyl-D-mannosaminuronate dehydrogenase